MKTKLLTILCLLCISAGEKKEAKSSGGNTVPYGTTPEERGMILRWRYTRLAGKVANHGEWLPSDKLALLDMWNKATTKAITTDGFTSCGIVNGVIIKKQDPPKILLDTDVATIQRRFPDRPGSKNQFRWSFDKQCVMMISYAESHGPRYEYFTDTKEREPAKAPPNMPKNEE